MSLGKALGIELPGEEAGLMPDPESLLKAKGEKWYTGNTYHAAIGQGDILTTPLQVNAITNIMANNGKLCKPYLVTNSQIQGGNWVVSFPRYYTSTKYIGAGSTSHKRTATEVFINKYTGDATYYKDLESGQKVTAEVFRNLFNSVPC